MSVEEKRRLVALAVHGLLDEHGDVEAYNLDIEWLQRHEGDKS